MSLASHEHNELPSEFGFRSGPRGTQTSRTMMLAELDQLLRAIPGSAAREEYLAGVIDDNLLAKQTSANRRLTAQRLCELYGLDGGMPLFSALRRLWAMDEAGRAVLACLCANARDPLLRATSGAVLPTQVGARVDKRDLCLQVEKAWPGRFRSGTLDQIGRNAASSWTQSGHLAGRVRKVRTRVKATAGTVTYAFLLGYLQGLRGARLFDTYWTSLLDSTPPLTDALVSEASRRGWLEYRRIGDVVQVGFRWLLEGQGE